MSVKDVIIIGAGPAGIATAIQLRRYNINAILLEQDEPGGLMMNANLIENYPGFPNGISGLELVGNFKQHLVETGIEVLKADVSNVDYINEVFEISTNLKVMSSKIVVIASGTLPKQFLRPVILDEMKDKIFYDIHRILNIKNKKIVVVGAGDAAFDNALNLSAANEVIILNRSKYVKCLPLLWERVQRKENISYIKNVKIDQFYNINKKMYLSCLHSDCKIESQIYADYVLIAIGRVPNLGFLGEQVKSNMSYLKESKKIFVVGDVKNNSYRQVGISVGDGIRAAMEISKILWRKYA